MTSAPGGLQFARLVSVLFNEPKLLKSSTTDNASSRVCGSFSALQRAEIAEIDGCGARGYWSPARFSALQRAEIAEILSKSRVFPLQKYVSVLFNEPKLLKSILQS